MHPNPIDTEPTGWLRLQRPLVIYEAEAIRAALLAQWPATGDVILDLGEPAECDVAGVQLLLAAQLKAVAENRRCCIRNMGTAVTTIAGRLGVPTDQLSELSTR